MDTEFLKTFGQIAGIGGLALVTFLILFREVIRKNIFPTLKKNDAYRLLRLIVGLISAVAIIGIVVGFKAVQVQAYKGIAAGDIRDNKIIINQYQPEEFEQMMRAAVESRDSKKNEQLSQKLAVNQVVLEGFFRSINQEKIPPEKWAETLASIASRYNSMLKRLAAFNSEDPVSQALIKKAYQAINYSEYDRADQLMETIEMKEMEAADALEQWVVEAQDKAKKRRLNAAAMRAERGNISLIRLHYQQAAAHFKAAFELVPDTDKKQRNYYLNRYAAALYQQGTQKVDNNALQKASEVSRELLKKYHKEQLPQDWARTQNNLGSVLREQGIRTGGQDGTRLLAEAVRAYQNALQVYTREQLPQDWAMTQNNLGNILSNQGIRTGGQDGTRLLAEAVRAYQNALQVYTREQLPQEWALTQNNLGNVLREQGIRTGGQDGTRLLAEAVRAYQNALEVRTREQPQAWAMTQNNLGSVLREQGIRTGGQAGTQLLADAVRAYQNALQVYTREQLPQQWAVIQRNLGRVLKELDKLKNEAGVK